MNYVAWALLGMACYSAVTLLVKLAVRTGEVNAFAVLAIATTIVCTSAWTIAIVGGSLDGKSVTDILRPGGLWACATGVALTIAVISLFKGLETGPANVVVPIYGMFILGGSLLGVLFLNEAMTLRKIVGLALCVGGVFLVAG